MKVHSVILLALVAQSLSLPFEGRIIGGHNAESGQFKHQVSIQSQGEHFCGGSIVNPVTILTAAHCIYNYPKDVTVLAGTNQLSEEGQRVPVERAIAHPDFDPYTLLNDIAILKLSAPLDLSGNVDNVRLRSSDVDVGETLTLSGWGLTSQTGGIPNDLQCIDLEAIDLTKCAHDIGSFNPIDIGHVCTTSPVNEGACNGDSGGPLIDSHGQQIGIVSWGYPCAKGLPDVFTSVPFYLTWIVSQT